MTGSKVGTVVILEGETGSGKTEAAVAYWMEMRAKKLVRGLYVGLPTRTSSVQIHGRVSAAVAARFPVDTPPVVLAVTGYARVGDENGKLVGHRVLWDDDASRLRGWATENSKRYLAAAVAIGTVDQLLLGVLEVKHGSMRWAASARSLLVIDEVHATDAYMSTLIVEAVERHVNRGGHVLLMSATLGSPLAQRCLAAARPSPMPTMPTLDEALALPYPLIRRAAPGKPTIVKEVASTGRTKDVRLVTHAVIDDADAVAELAAAHVRAGAKVLVIRNTVAACNATHRRLETMLSPDQMMRSGPNRVTAPHHGRFSPEDRRALDEAIGETFGKGTPSRGVVLCATQTVEQSLDIDVDVLITDICPMDVLLQRIGRLHRHLVDGRPKGRPEGYGTPTAHILVPDQSLEAYALKAANGIGIDRAYGDVRTVEATLRLVVSRPGISIPRDNRNLVELCCHPEALAGVERSSPALEAHGREVSGRGFADKGIARSGIRDTSWRHGDQVGGIGDTKATTRLGERDLDLPFESPPISALGIYLSSVRIPFWLSPRDTLGFVPRQQCESLADGTLMLRIGGDLFSYGRCGLEKAGAHDVELGRGAAGPR